MHRLISKHTKPSLNEPVKPYFPCQWVLFLSLGGLATKLWAKSANCPSEAAEVQTPNTPPLSSPDHNSQLPHTHSHTHTQDESVSLTTEEPGNSLAFNTHSTAQHTCIRASKRAHTSTSVLPWQYRRVTGVIALLIALDMFFFSSFLKAFSNLAIS